MTVRWHISTKKMHAVYVSFGLFLLVILMEMFNIFNRNQNFFQVENKVNSSSTSEDLQDKPQTPTSYYDSSKSFFDSISCEANDRDRNRR